MLPHFSRRLLRWCLSCGVILFIVSLIGLFTQARGADNSNSGPHEITSTVITSFEQIWQMTEAETKQWHRLRMEYVVYYYDPLWKALWGRCGEADSYLSVGSKPFPIKPRQKILVEGLICPERGMIVEEPKVTILAESVPVEVLSTRGEVGNSERFNKRLVTVEGYIDRQSARDANHHELTLVAEGQTLLTQVVVRNGEAIPQLKGSLIRAEGLYFARNEPTWTSPKFEIWVQGFPAIEVIGQLNRDERFNLPVTPLNQLTTANASDFVHVLGEVQAQELGKTLRIRDETGILTIQSAQTLPLAAKDRVEIIGHAVLQGRDWTLEQALYRRAQPLITTFDGVWQLPETEKNQTHPVRFDFIVYYFDPIWKNVWGRCAGVDGYLSLDAAKISLKPGQHVLIDGQVTPGPEMRITDTRITMLADSGPLEFMSTNGQITNTARFDRHLTAIEGYVDRQTEVNATHVQLNLVAEGQAITVQILRDDQNPVPALEGALLQCKGVYSATFDPSSGLSKIELWVQSSRDISVKGSLAQAKQFDLPATPIDGLTTASPDKVVRVLGAVRTQQVGKSLTIRDETGQVVLLSPQTKRMQLGTQVEAVGFPNVNGTEWQLRDGLFRTAASPPSAPAAGKTTLRLAEQLRELSTIEAAQGIPVQITGIVTWSNSAADFFFVHDASGGVCVFQPPQRNPNVGVGAKVTITGVSAPGKFSPVVLASLVHVSARIDLPEAKQVTIEQALTGIEEGQLVSMSGFIREVSRDGPWAKLAITTSGGEFEVLLAWRDHLLQLRHSVARVRGVCTALTNGKRQLTGIRLWVVSDQSIEIEEAEPADPFSVPAQSITSLRQFNSLQSANRRTRITGVVVYRASGLRLLIQDGSESVLVLSRDTTPLVLGDRIEAVGFPGRENGRVILREAVYRRLGSGAEPTPLKVSSLEKINVELDNQLVHLEAVLLDLDIREKSTDLLMQLGNVIFTARLENQLQDGLEQWVPGSRLGLNGIYQIEFDEYKQPHDIQIQLRSQHDLTLISAAPWWTVGRALLATGILAIGILLGFGWVVALRRRVRQQTGLIHAQVESEKAARLEIALARASKLESLGVLAGGIAHDFNNLLTVVMGNLSLAKLDPRIEPETVQCLEESERAAVRARDLTQQLITFAKGGEPVRTSTILSQVVEEATKFALHGSKVRSEYNFASKLWPAEVDKGQIGQAVHNLIINAAHAMPGGGVVRISLANDEVTKELRSAPAPGRYLRLSIADTGTGIAPELLQRIFDPYFTTKEKGSGLGLASVYSIIKKHQGHVEVSSTLGEGSTFTLWLPAVAAAPVTEQSSPPTAVENVVAKTKIARVLLMDDESAIRNLGGAIFKRMGIAHTAVADGAAALHEYAAARASGQAYDLVMLDLTIPGGMGGAETIEKLRQMDPTVKAIVSSGYSNDPVMANYRAHGFLGVIPKPYVIAEFIKTITPMLPAGVTTNPTQ